MPPADAAASAVALAAGTEPPSSRYLSPELLADGTRGAMERRGSGRLTGTVTTGGQAVSFNCDFTTAPATADYLLDCGYGLPTSSGATTNLRMIVTPTALFVHVPTAPDGDASPWRQIDLASKDHLAAQLVDARNIVRQAVDVAGWLPSDTTIDGVADEQLDSAPATRYDLTVGLSALADKETDPALRARTQHLAGLGKRTAHTTVWVDAQGLPAQLTTTLPTSALHERGVGDTTVLTHFGQWGSGTVISAPPADQVSTYPEAH